MALSTQLTIKKATDLLGGGFPDKAREILEQTLKVSPDDVDVRMLLGEVYDALGWLSESVEQYETQP